MTLQERFKIYFDKVEKENTETPFYKTHTQTPIYIHTDASEFKKFF